MNIRNIFIQTIQETFEDITLENQTTYLEPTLLAEGTTIQSFDETYENTITSESFFGWINWNPDIRFEKPVTYGYIDAKTLEVTFENNVNFWPEIEGYADYDAYAEENIILEESTTTIEGDLPETIYSSEPPGDPKDSICAVLVSGFDKRPKMQASFDYDLELFKNNLMNEKLGPGLNEANIRIEKMITGDSLREILISMYGKYKKVYFFYSGHGTRNDLCLGKTSEDWFSYNSLLIWLDHIEAKDNCIVLDCCFSGNVMTQSALDDFGSRNVEIYTSSNIGKTSFSKFHNVNNSITGYGAFNLALMKCFGEPAAERNGSEGTSLKEAFDWFYKQPENKEIITKQCPMHLLKRRATNDTNEAQTTNLEDTDLSIRQNGKGSNISYALDVEHLFETIPIDYNDQNIFAISPNRRWSVNEVGSVSSDNTIDLIFTHDEGLDSLNNTMGIYGVVYRLSDTTEWLAYYPVEYNLNESTITALDVTIDNAQYALGRIVDINSTEEVDFDVVLYPNPASEYLNLSTDFDSEITYSIVDITGKQILGNTHKISANEVKVDISSLQRGPYYLLLHTDTYTKALAFIKH